MDITSRNSRGRKRPYFIHRRDGRPVGLAALAESWVGPNGEEATRRDRHRARQRDLAALHHRVPVTIAPEEFERWLDCRLDNADDVMPLLRRPKKASRLARGLNPGQSRRQ